VHRGGVLARWTGNAQVLTKIVALPQRDGAIAKRLHALFELLRVPAYAMSSDFPRGTEVKTTYATLVFSEQSQLDGGHMWPTTFAPRGLPRPTRQRLVSHKYGYMPSSMRVCRFRHDR
jgi:hypothetical protein